MMDFTVASFNAHWGFGKFGRLRGTRFAVDDVVRGFESDIVVIAESWREVDGRGAVDELAAEGYHVEHVHLMRLAMRKDRAGLRDVAPREGGWEISICTRFPILDRREYVIGDIKADPVGKRLALALTLDVSGRPIQVIGLHTSSRVHLLAPVRHLLGLKKQLDDDKPQVLAGDFNFWGPPIGMLMPGWQRPVRGRTYPAHRPHSQIDHILVRNGIEALSGEVLPPTPSDHRPVRARLRLVR